MIPDGWKRKNLGEVITLQRGFDLPEQDRIHGTIPIISSSGITGFHNESKVSPPGIVTGRYGTIGKVFLVDVDFWPLNTSLWVKDFYENDRRYVYYLLQSIDYKKLSDKTGVPGINRNDVHKLRVLLPPISEQCKIAEILGVWDESIDLLEKLIGRVRSRKQGLMQQLLTGKKRFKEFEGSEWKTSKLSEITSYNKGYTYKSEEYSDVETNTYLITLKCIEKGGGFQRIGLKHFNDKINTKLEVFEGDLLFANTDLTRDAEVVGSPVLIPSLGGKRAMISMDLTKVTIAKEKLHKPFLYYLMKSFSIRNSFRAMASGSTVLHLDTNGTKKISLNLPSLPEQEKIAAVLSAADEEISTLEKQLAAYKQQKLGLMQQLLTGSIRI